MSQAESPVCECGKGGKLPRGMCVNCYQRWRRRRPASMIDTRSPAERFWAKVEKTETCWLWRGRTDKGYGRYSSSGAHRYAYQLEVGPIPEGLEIDHLCRNTICVNPEHLEAVTHAENMARRAAAITHCYRGHEFTEDNTYLVPGAKHRARFCRTCRRAAGAATRLAKRKAVENARLTAEAQLTDPGMATTVRVPSLLVVRPSRSDSWLEEVMDEQARLGEDGAS